MNSCLYRARVMHHRLLPKPHRFHYDIYQFYLDLDELESLRKKFTLFSLNRFNAFSFRDKEHLQYPRENPDTTKNTREQIIAYGDSQGVDLRGAKIMLLTNLNIFGYNFNPVSFYFCSDKEGTPLCCIVEITNTFLEMKPYYAGPELLEGKRYHLRTPKYFYVSPFIDHDTELDFRMEIPDGQLRVKVDDYTREGERFFISTLTGTRKAITGARLLWYSLRFPFLTLRIIFLIHWHALRLWLKRLPFHKKDANPHLQKGVYRKYGK